MEKQTNRHRRNEKINQIHKEISSLIAQIRQELAKKHVSMEQVDDHFEFIEIVYGKMRTGELHIEETDDIYDLILELESKILDESIIS